MNIALFGASGTIGRRIAQEALARGHTVTALTRDPQRIDFAHERLHIIQADVRDPASVAQAVAGQDVVVSAIGPTGQEGPAVVLDAARALTLGLARAGVRRLLVVGGAGSLEVAPGVQLVDTPDFHTAWRPVALAHREALRLYRESDLDWTVLSPAAFIAPGQRSGGYRTGTDQLLLDDKGESRISTEDYAVALVDEVDASRFVRRRFTVAY